MIRSAAHGCQVSASPWVDILEQPWPSFAMSFISDETIFKTHAWSILSRLAHASGFKMIEIRVIEAVERSPHQQPATGPDLRLRGSKR